jgi:hypothetical protein
MSAFDALQKVNSNTGDAPLAPGAAVTAPTGGATVDAEARTAINTVITRLETLGLIEAN